MKHCKNILMFAVVLSAVSALAQVEVDVNWNIRHSVGGVDDFGRERHITVHSSLIETDWDGEEDKLDYLINDLDVYFGRDNGSATWKFASTSQDVSRVNYPDIDHMEELANWLKGEYDAMTDRHQYESHQQEMIMGTNPHPTYPTLSWYDNGFTWTDPKWQPLLVETSADWMVEYLDRFFRKSGESSGEKMPKYWEVINEPDMLLMTGAFMVSSWENLWKYHNLVATGVKARLGNDAPMIGGMTWGLHDIHSPDGLSRYASNNYDQWITDPAGAAFYREASYTAYPRTGNEWEQWDTIWQGFIDACGANMDFYSVHIYDWPGRGLGTSPTIRAGGHTEGLLDILEWYDVYKYGTRKPVVLSEYGSVNGGYINAGMDGLYIDWECIRPWNSMMMQFLERPDYLIKTMPFTPIKATWGDFSATQRYPYAMLDETSSGSDVWEWTGYIKWFEFWKDVEGTRVETLSSDPDIQVDCYVDGSIGYLILNNLEDVATTINLNEYGLSRSVNNVEVRQLYCANHADYSGTSAYPVLDVQTQSAPSTVTLQPDATMILKYNFSGSVSPGQSVVETKYYGSNLSGGMPFRVTGNSISASINGVNVPSGAAEATLRISGMFWSSGITSDDTRNQVTVNGHAIQLGTDWRGDENTGRWLGTLEIPVPVEYLQQNNSITCYLINNMTYACVALQVFDFSTAPGRSDNPDPITGPPVFSSDPINKSAATEGSAYSGSIAGNASDPDGDSMTFSRVSGPSWLSVASNGSISGTPTSSDVGNNSWTVQVSTSDGSDTATLNITVNADNPVNQAPVFSSSTITKSAATENASYSGTISGSATDADGDSLTYSKVSGPAWLSVASGGALSGTPGSSDVGANSWSVQVSDGNGGTDTATLNITVNDAGDPGDDVTLTIEAENFDVNGGVQTYTHSTGDGINYVEANDYVEYNVSVPQAGTYTIDYYISTPLDGSTITFRLNGTDVVTDSVPNNGSWDVFTSATRSSSTVALTAGANTIRLVAGSNAWQWNLDKVVLTTSGGSTPVNQAPEFSSSTINKSAATENSAYSGTISGSATDADGDSLTYSKASGPSWLSVASNGSLSGTPGSGDVGNNSWTVQVSDGSLTDTATLNITVNADVPNNQAPAFGSSSISKANATENSSYSATISGSATDSDGDSLTYSKVSGPAWLSVASNGSLSGTPASSDVGANSWTVQVSDGSLTDTATLNITVDAEVVTGQTPYGGSARSLASQIEAEDYDEGGEDVAYNDTTSGNSGNSYRTSENVDVQSTSDTGGGYNVGWMADGEWLEYTVNATAGTYDINLRVASVNSGRQLRVVLDGVTLATLDVPNTGGWQAWQTVTAEDIVISGGNNKILRIEVIGNGQNLNWIEFDAVSTDPDPDPDPASFTIEAEDFDVNGGVQTYTTGGITAINWVQSNEYVEYNVNVPAAGTYNIDYYTATPLSNKKITFSLNGTAVVTDTVPNNGSWDVYTSPFRSSGTVTLSAGANTIRIAAGSDAWNWNLDKVVLSK